VDFAGGVVVVAVDAVDLAAVADEVDEGGEGGVHHLVPVGGRVGLGPQQVVDVGGELGGALGEPGEVGVLEAALEGVGEVAGEVDVAGGQLVADTARSGVEDEPHLVGLVEAHFKEVVPGTEGAELVAGAPLELVGEGVGGEPGLGGVGGGGVPLAEPGRDGPGDEGLVAVEVVGEPGGGDVGGDGDHPAADVDPHGGGDDGVSGGDDRADGGAHADMGVGH
jgi:hypothetical protein